MSGIYKKKREKYFWSYLSAMADLDVSRRTLQRWLDDLDIKSLEFEDHLKVFLTLPNIENLRNYGKVMKTRNQSLITRYRSALVTDNHRRMARVLRDAADFGCVQDSGEAGANNGPSIS